jgi:hypothetical protein
VGGWVGVREVDIELSVDSATRWWINGIESPTVYGCIDIDLNFSPVTNLLPIRRLNLAIGQEAKVKAAWLRFPSFALEPIEQLYSRIGINTYQYKSGSLTTKLPVNELGFVISYPDYWELEAFS